MDYQRIYDQIIDRAQKESREKGKEIYYEKHHILPKCLGGSDEKENLVLLTGREHFLCHWILTRIHPGNNKVIYAFWGMCNKRSKGQEKRYIPSSRTYEEARRLSSQSKVYFFKTEEGKALTAKRIANTDYSIRTANFNYAARTANFDYQAMVANTNYSARTANTNYEKRSDKFRKAIIQFHKDGTLVKEWGSVKEAGETLKINRGSISGCLKERLKSAGGFIWKYVK